MTGDAHPCAQTATCVGISVDNNNTPRVVWDHDNGSVQHQPLHQVHRWNIHPERRCTGRTPTRGAGIGTWQPCPTRSRIESGQHCAACTAANGFHTIHQLGRGAPPPTNSFEADYINASHRLYLAAFSGNLLKIGTAHTSRGTRRLTEQGAIAAHWIAECVDGIVVRQLEIAVDEQLGISQAVRAKRKTQALADGATVEAARHLIESRRHQVVGMAATWADTSIIDEAVTTIDDHHRLVDGTWRTVGGPIVAGCWELDIVDSWAHTALDNDNRLWDLKPLIGAVCELDAGGDSWHPNQQQTTLF